MALLNLMGQSLTHLLVHAIFSTKDRRPFLHSEEIRNEIYAYMAGTLKNLDCHPIKIGGIEDHVHVFSSLSKNIALSDLIGDSRELHQSASKRRASKALGGRMDTVPSPSASPTWNRSRPISSTRQSIIRNLATRKRFVKFSNAIGPPSTNAMFGIEAPRGFGRPFRAGRFIHFTQG